MELQTLVDYLIKDDTFKGIITNRFAQFGIPEQRAYLGATLFPEKTDIPITNQFRESFIRYRSPIANASTRYSPPQFKGGTLVGSMLIELTESDIASEFDAGEYDTLINLLVTVPNNAPVEDVPEQALLIVLNWFDKTITRPLVEYNEKMIWDCLVDAQVVGKGDNGFQITIDYLNNSGQRVQAGGNWSDPTYDPFPDIIAMVTSMTDAGFKVSRLIASTKVATALQGNPKIAARIGILNITSSVVAGLPGYVSFDALNNLFAANSLPPIEKYDLQFQTQTGTGRFLKEDVLVMIPSTDRDVEILSPDAAVWQLNGTLGYVGVGRPTNRNENGRAFTVKYEDGKAAPVTATGWQTSLPVNMFPDGIRVITDVFNVL